MDGIIIVAVIVAVCVYFRRFDKAVYGVGIVDIFLRIFNYLITNVKIDGITDYLVKYLPESIPSVIKHYTSGALADVLIWVYVIAMGCFLFFTIKAFIKKK